MNKWLLLWLTLVLFSSSLNADVFPKDLAYDNHTLEDTYTYRKQERAFQWQKMDSILKLLEDFQKESYLLGYVRNYKNRTGLTPLIAGAKRNRHGNYVDDFQTERYQSAPLYTLDLDEQKFILKRYARDGSLCSILKDSAEHYEVVIYDIPGERWFIPKKYVKSIGFEPFKKTIFVDRKYQNIATMQLVDSLWTIKSMNPATTGVHHPPHKKETPLGTFVVMQQKEKMFFLKDGTRTIGGFSPYASRFSGGGYIHGVPVNLPRKTPIEFSWSLGTTPRSHMCVRNATSHAKYIFDWVNGNDTLVVIIE